MEKENKKKTSSELIVDALRTGRELKLSEITELMSQSMGKPIRIQNVSSTIAKLSDSSKTELGHFISRQKSKRGYLYKLADEALELTPEETYGLVRKVGKNRFTLKEAIERVPALKKYVSENDLKTTPETKLRKKKRDTASEREKKPSTPEATAGSGQDGAEPFMGIQLANALEQLKDGTININVTVNIRLIG